MLSAHVADAAQGAAGQLFMHRKCYAAGGTGSGASAGDPASAADSDVMAIPARSVIDQVQVVVTTAVTGSSPQINVGDDDDPNGYVEDADVTEGSTGASIGSGAYPDAGPKYYSATGKEVKFDAGGTISAGAFCIIVKGYRF